MGVLGSLFLLMAGSAPSAAPPGSRATAPRTQDGAVAREIDFSTLLAALESNDLGAQWDTMQRFAQQASAPEAIEALLAEMRRRAPALDNNVGLALELILRAHPDAPCALEPLLEAIARPVWNSQQKCAQALLPLLQRGDGKGRVRELSAALIPMLTSQRPRVFDAGRRCLEALTGEAHGDVPEAWLVWYEREFAQPLLLQGAVYEDLIVIRPRVEGAGEAERLRFEVEEQLLESSEELRALLELRAQRAREQGLSLGVVFQIANERLTSATDLQHVFEAADVRAVFALCQGLGIHDLVVSPMSDGFRGPWRSAHGDGRAR